MWSSYFLDFNGSFTLSFFVNDPQTFRTLQPWRFKVSEKMKLPFYEIFTHHLRATVESAGLPQPPRTSEYNCLSNSHTHYFLPNNLRSLENSEPATNWAWMLPNLVPAWASVEKRRVKHTPERRRSLLTKCYWDKHFPSSHLVPSPSKSAARRAPTAYLLALLLTEFSVLQHKFH